MNACGTVLPVPRGGGGGGGLGKTISNDNLVELMLQLVKKKLREQGSNFTYANEVKAVLPSQVQEEVKKNLQEELKQKPKGIKVVKY